MNSRLFGFETITLMECIYSVKGNVGGKGLSEEERSRSTIKNKQFLAGVG